MSSRIMKRIVPCALVVALWLQVFPVTAAYSAPENTVLGKELNFVFLHGAGGDSCGLQLLSDSMAALLPYYISEYERKHPGIRVRYDTLNRCYPNDVDIQTWADNIAESIERHFRKRNLILIGHSMGGKAGLYATAHNSGNLTERVAMVVTINSPVKKLSDYYFPGGVDYWEARWAIGSDRGVLGSIAYYDSRADGLWVGSNKHWLALVSGEASPISNQFDTGGLDPLPRDMDDYIVPVSAQYSDGADAIYYGEFGHSDFSTMKDASDIVAEQILRYVFGLPVECSVFARGGDFEHMAGWQPVTYSWEDRVGEVPGFSGTVYHSNSSIFGWQEWVDIVGVYLPFADRGSATTRQVNPIPLLADIVESFWANPDDPHDCRLLIRTRAAPLSSIRVEWSIGSSVLLATDTSRDRYEIEISTGTPFTGIEEIWWLTDEPRDVRMVVRSYAQGPLRWFKANWRAYSKEIRIRNIIDELPGRVLEVPAQPVDAQGVPGPG